MTRSESQPTLPSSSICFRTNRTNGRESSYMNQALSLATLAIRQMVFRSPTLSSKTKGSLLRNGQVLNARIILLELWKIMTQGVEHSIKIQSLTIQTLFLPILILALVAISKK
jgi:hypothetical protein